MNAEPAKPLLSVVASVRTDVGCLRATNEDCALYINPSGSTRVPEQGVLSLVADGMGGHSAGEVASRLAVEVVSRAFFESDLDPQAALVEAFEQANEQIYRRATESSDLRGMGTTCTALLLRDHGAFSAHVGDSRLYLVRDGEIFLMTEDHSVVMEMVRRGVLTPEAARHHSEKNVILRALGNRPKVRVSLWKEPFPVEIGDRFVLSTDGLHDLIDDEEIKDVVLSLDPHAASERLIDMAKTRGGHDNITVVVIAIGRYQDSTKPRVRETREFSPSP